jgi:hypothetical protein
MFVNFITRVAKWLAIIFALQCPADAWSMDNLHSVGAEYAMPMKQSEDVLASLPPPNKEEAPSTEPFGLMVVPVVTGELLAKWRSVQRDISAEDAVLAL